MQPKPVPSPEDAEDRIQGRRSNMLHKVEINEQGVCLDGKPLEGVRSYRLSHYEGENAAALLLKMDVTILPNVRNSKFNTFLDKAKE